MKYTLTILEEHRKELEALVLKDDGFERPALLLCGRSFISNDIWDGGTELRFLSKVVIPIPENEVVSNNEAHVKWKTETFRKALKLAEKEDLSICIVHSHPAKANEFSGVDDKNERELIQTIYNRNGDLARHLSLVITYERQIFGRVWDKKLNTEPIQFIRCFGDRFEFIYKGKFDTVTREAFHRQQLAFGQTLNNDLSKLRIAVIGCGATGSCTAHLLARLGVGQLLLVDNDLVERTNLSRLYGANGPDADAGRSKAYVVRDFIAAIAMGCRVRAIHDWVGSATCRDALKSCDVIFCCTDDDSGRIFLNRFDHFYLAPVFDIGIHIKPTDTHPPQIQTLQGRLTVVLPGNTCLLCRNIVSVKRAYEENLKRSDPDGYERLKEEAYVEGGGNPNPAVITFTTEVATMAVNEFIHRITGFKKVPATRHVVRFFDQNEDRKPGAISQDGCPICNSKSYWGRGDVDPFMDGAY